MPPNEGEPNAETIEERIFNHDDEAFHVRTDWFLVGHGILFEAFFSALAHDGASWIALPVWIFGVVAAWAWLSTAVWQVKTLSDVKTHFREAARVYDEIQRRRGALSDKRSRYIRVLFPWQHGTGVFGYVLPMACLGSWLGIGGIQWGTYFLRLFPFIKAHAGCTVAGADGALIVCLIAWLVQRPGTKSTGN